MVGNKQQQKPVGLALDQERAEVVFSTSLSV